MFDNGLLQACNGSTTKKGYLKLGRTNFNITPHIHTQMKSIDKLNCCGKEYFYKVASKEEYDAEILLSQIAKSIGLNCAVYLPVNVGLMQNGVASDSLEQIGCICSREMDSTAKYITDSLLMPKEYGERDLKYYSEIITKDAMRDLIKTRLFQFASSNTDGNKDNMFYKLNENGIIESVYSLDNAMGYNFVFDEGTYYNEFCDEFLTSEEMIEQFKENETMKQFIKPQELAEAIGSVNIQGIANDITNTLGYNIGQKFVDGISSSYDSIAEQLI